MKLTRRTALLASLLLTPCVHADEPRAKAAVTLSFGVVPQQAASTLAQLWTPVLTQLENATGYRFVFRTAPNIPEFEQRLARGKYDVAYMNPYHFTVFNRGPGYRALARVRDKQIQGIVVTRKDSGLDGIRSLDGQVLAFPAPAAFAASVLPRARFKNDGIKVTARYVSSHDSVYKAVAQGLYPAGGGIMRTFNNVDPAVREQLRILWKTPTYTPHAFASHPRLDPEVAQRIQAALVALDQNEDGRSALSGLNMRGLTAAANEDWDDVRALGLELLDALVTGRE